MSTDATTDLVTLTIDDHVISVPPGTIVIRAAEQIGIHIPRFCDHPLLKPVGACRQCVVEVGTPGPDGSIRWMPKPQSSCTTTVSEGMVIKTQFTSAAMDKAQTGIMEFLLINHPLDCPVCDKGGECPLQNQAMSDGRGTSRFVDAKRTWPKPINISAQILLDRERCIMCQRCTRFVKEIAGDHFIDLQQRGAKQEIGRFEPEVLGIEGEAPDNDLYIDNAGDHFASYFSGNIIQICPVGALTSAAYRFRARPFDLRSIPGVGEHDSSGAAIRVDVRRDVVMRRLSGNDPEVNEEWITDKDRFAFHWQTAADRLSSPLVRLPNPDGSRGELVPASWPVALEAATAGLSGTRTGVITGGRVPMEDAYAYGKFARLALGTNDIDFRSRYTSPEETAFLGAHVAGTGLGVTFTDLERAKHVLLVGFEPEEEGGIVFLRLRKANRLGTSVYGIAPFASRGLARMGGTLLATAPGGEALTMGAITPDNSDELFSSLAASLAEPGSIILVGERLAGVPGGYAAAVDLAERTGARLAWIPRRAGERGALEAGALGTLLPGGRPVADAAARVDAQTVWGVESLPTEPGRDAAAMWAAAASGDLEALVVGGLEIADQPDQDTVRAGLERAFVVSLEVRRSDVTEFADVVLPVAPIAERGGTFVNWEGRVRPFGQALTSVALPEHRVLAMLADSLGTAIGTHKLIDVHRELEQFEAWDGERAAGFEPEPVGQPLAEAGELSADEAILATWHFMLDDGRGQDGEQFLAATAKRPIARISPATAEAIGASEAITVATDRGEITLTLIVTADMVDGVVWVPANSVGSKVAATLGARAGDRVRLAAATPPSKQEVPA